MPSESRRRRWWRWAISRLRPLADLGPADRAAVESARRSETRARVLVLGSVLLVNHAVYSLIYALAPGSLALVFPAWRTNLQIIHASAIVAGAIVIASAYRRWRYAGEAFVILYLIYGSLVSLNSLAVGRPVDVFIIVVVGIPLAIRVRPMSWIVGSTGATTAVVIASQADPNMRFGITNNLIPLMVVTWAAATLQFAAFVRDISQRLLIERQRDELSTLSALLERQLRQSLINRSREIALAIGKLEPANVDELAPGRVLLERFEIVCRIGIGGMGVVYRANDRLIGRAVALKVIRSAGDVPSVQRFLREVEAIAEIDHPTVVRAMYVDVTPEGRLFQTQELIVGESLDVVHRRTEGFPAEHVAAIGEALATALEAAHARGVVHRDIKPSNVMLVAEEPGLKLLDFGVAKLRTEGALQTQSGVAIGTPGFMAPEQRSAADATMASDIYSLGMTLWTIAVRPLDAPPASGLLARAGGSARLYATLARCLHRDPSERPPASTLRALFAELGGELSLSVRNAALLAPASSSATTQA